MGIDKWKNIVYNKNRVRLPMTVVYLHYVTKGNRNCGRFGGYFFVILIYVAKAISSISIDISCSSVKYILSPPSDLEGDYKKHGLLPKRIGDNRHRMEILLRQNKLQAEL